MPKSHQRSWHSKRGAIYKLGRHRLMCGDATNSSEVEELMNGKTADMVFTDPPYNVGYIGKTQSRLSIKNDKLKADKYQSLLELAFKLLCKHSKPGAPIYICHASKYTPEVMNALQETDWYIAQTLIWAKHHFALGRSDYHWKHEPILYGWKHGAPHPWYSDRKQSTLLHFPKPMRNTLHPTMKPIALMEYALNNSSKPEDIVVDTFGGSGSTLVAAELTSRIAYIMELDPAYCDVIRMRYNEHRSST